MSRKISIANMLTAALEHEFSCRDLDKLKKFNVSPQNVYPQIPLH